MSPQATLWSTFGIVMVAFLAVDLGLLNRKPHAVSVRSAAIQSLFWVAVSAAFGALVWHLLGAESGAQWYSAYVAEKVMSLDNAMLILAVFAWWKVAPEYRHRVLYMGIAGAYAMRALFIGLGTGFISRWHFLLLPFGLFLIWGAWKMLKGGDDDEGFDGDKSKVAQWAMRHLPFTVQQPYGRLFARDVAGRTCVTTLFVTLLCVEATDFIMAFDSLPTTLAITSNFLVAFTANAFALAGLRAMFFIVDGLIARLRYISYGVAFALAFIGAKIVADVAFHYEVSSVTSMVVVLGGIWVAAVFSLLNPELKPETT